MKDKIFETCKLNPDHPTPRVYRVTLCDMGHKGGQIFWYTAALAAHITLARGWGVARGDSPKSPLLRSQRKRFQRSDVPTMLCKIECWQPLPLLFFSGFWYTGHSMEMDGE